METAIEINNVVNSADIKVKHLPIEQRDCIFTSEKKLQNFDMYSYV